MRMGINAGIDEVVREAAAAQSDEGEGDEGDFEGDEGDFEGAADQGVEEAAAEAEAAAAGAPGLADAGGAAVAGGQPGPLRGARNEQGELVRAMQALQQRMQALEGERQPPARGRRRRGRRGPNLLQELEERVPELKRDAEGEFSSGYGVDTEEEYERRDERRGDRRHRRRGRGARLSREEKQVLGIWNNLRKSGSATLFVRNTRWRDKPQGVRNRRECERAAAAIDDLMEAGITWRNPGMATLLRNLAGVHLAEVTGNWDVCDELGWANTERGLLERDDLFRVLRGANKFSSFKSGRKGGAAV
jgi:hypothetical protein